MGFIGIANAYAMRSVLSVAITEMVTDIHKTVIDPNGCPGPLKTKNTTNVVCIKYILSWFLDSKRIEEKVFVLSRWCLFFFLLENTLFRLVKMLGFFFM